MGHGELKDEVGTKMASADNIKSLLIFVLCCFAFETGLSEEIFFSGQEQVPAPPVVVREKRAALGPFEDALSELRRFRNQKELTEDEDKFLRDRTVYDPVVLMRLVTTNYDGVDNVTVEGTNQFTAAADEFKDALLNNVIADSGSLVDTLYVPSIADLGLDDQNRTQVQVTVLMVAKETGEDILRALATNFTKHGVMVKGSLDVTHVYYKAYAKRVDKRTVYGLYLRLTELVYMPMFTNLDNTATLKVTNELVLTSRPLFRNRFGEYFFRSVVMEYFEGPVLGDTIVSMAFLLEENEDNLIDVDSIWLVQIREHGQLGNHPIRTDGYIVSELNFVPEKFEKYLVAEITREELQLDASAFIADIALPSLAVMMLILVFVLLCAWEGFCCRRCIEGEEGAGKGCLCCNFSNYDHIA